MKKFCLLFLVLVLSGCFPPLQTLKMHPSNRAFNGINQEYFLKSKLAVSNKAEAWNNAETKYFMNFPKAVQYGFSKVGLLHINPEKAKYIVNTQIKDVKAPFCLLGYCETGSTVNYIITDKDAKVVYSELVVVPYTHEYPLFSDNNQNISDAIGGALGENIAHITRVLMRKTKSDFK